MFDNGTPHVTKWIIIMKYVGEKMTGLNGGKSFDMKLKPKYKLFVAFMFLFHNEWKHCDRSFTFCMKI